MTPPVSSPTASPSSYREQLRANGLGALQGSRAAAVKPTASQAPSPAASLTFFPPPPSFAGLQVGAAARALPQFDPATPDASARSPPAALPPTAFGVPPPPFVPAAEVCSAMQMQPMAPMACGWPDLSPIAATVPSPVSATPMNFFDQTPHAAFRCFGGMADLMAIAMPQAAGGALDREELAAQLRAAAPAVYED